MFGLSYSKTAENYLSSLSTRDRLRIVRKLETARDDPFHYFTRLQGSNFWRMRVGDHQLIADIILVNQKIFVIRIGNRKNVYD
jgi:mRNA-degrading endonuclease RelE of RelBE toxin-antitoxin system